MIPTKSLKQSKIRFNFILKFITPISVIRFYFHKYFFDINCLNLLFLSESLPNTPPTVSKFFASNVNLA